jgi:dolichyl-phosphate-mannose--protein O-mannosyl transferase
MLSWFKKYWIEILVFAAILAGYLLCCATNYTWINTDCDGAHYVYAAKWFYPAHLSSAPLYLIIGHFFTLIPFGTDFWNLALLSVLCAVISCWFVYAIVKLHTTNRTAAIIAAIIYGGSALAISQGTIVETYSMVTMFMLGAYYFTLKSKWWLVAVMLGAGLCGCCYAYRANINLGFT